MRRLLLITCMTLMVMSCTHKNNTITQMAEIFPKGQKAPTHFTGDTWVQMLTVDAENFDVMSYNVTFAPGSRTDWHSHPGGQILYCTSGKGYYQEKGKTIQHLIAGDVVEIKPDVVHWHGAAPNSEFVHLGISTQLSKGAVVWYNAVTEGEYCNSTR